MEITLTSLIFCIQSLALGDTREVLDDSAASGDKTSGLFDFGKNWMTFLDGALSDPPMSNVSLKQRVQGMADHLSHDFGLDTFEGKSFLDIGCGSGLASLAALSLGARHVVSVDFQFSSVQATRELRRYFYSLSDNYDAAFQKHSKWDIIQGSILSPELSESLQAAHGLKFSDLVYCYGVIMHTGNAQLALQNLANLIAPGGLLLVFGHFQPGAGQDANEDSWISFKKSYNSMPAWKQRESLVAWNYLQISKHMSDCLGKLNTSLDQVSTAAFDDFQRVQSCTAEWFQWYTNFNRGMDFLTDAHDWLGGYPYDVMQLPKYLEFMQGFEPRIKVVRILYSGLVGILVTPRTTGAQHYMHDGRLVGYWSRNALHSLVPENFFAIDEYHPSVDVMERGLRGHWSDETITYYQDVLFSQGRHCFFYVFPEEWDHTYPQSVLLRNFEFFAWGDHHEDKKLCYPGEGPRFRILPFMLIFSTSTGIHPKFENHTYQLLRARGPWFD